jgi:hypothetical protein
MNKMDLIYIKILSFKLHFQYVCTSWSTAMRQCPGVAVLGLPVCGIDFLLCVDYTFSLFGPFLLLLLLFVVYYDVDYLYAQFPWFK